MIVIPIFSLAVGLNLFKDVVALAVSKDRRDNRWDSRLASLIKEPILIVGIGKIGKDVVNFLINKGLLWDIVIIHDDITSPNVLSFREKGIPVIIGDMTEEFVLSLAQIQNAHTVILATEDDETHFRTILKISEMLPKRQKVDIIFNMYDIRIAEIIKNFQTDNSTRLKLHPINLSESVAMKIASKANELNSDNNARYSICGLGRVGFTVARILSDEKGKFQIPLSNITVIDLNIEKNKFASLPPIANFSEKNKITMDMLDFYSNPENHFDVNIITTGDDISNFVFESLVKNQALNFVRTKSSHRAMKVSVATETIEKDTTVWINTSKTAAQEITALYEEISADNKI